MEREARLQRLVRQTQAQARIPALSVAVHRADRPLWTFQVGDVRRPDAPLDAGTLFRMGSVTKTFTAVLVLQCRDDGLLDLDDPVAPAPRRAGARRADRSGGCCRTPRACSASRTATSGTRCSCRTTDAAARRPRAGSSGCCRRRRRYHYSNLGLSLLGHLVGAAARRHLGRGAGRPRARPARADRRGAWTRAPRGGGRATWSTPYSDHARPEPPTGLRRRSARPRQLWAHRRRPGPVGRLPGRPGRGGPDRRGAGSRPRWRRCAGRSRSPMRRSGPVGLRARADRWSRSRTGWSTSATTARCRASSPAPTAGGAAPARRARRRARGARLVGHRRGDVSCRTTLLAAAAARTRPTCGRGRPGEPAPAELPLGAGPLVERGLRVRLLLARRRAAGPPGRRPGRAARRRSSSRSDGRTSSAPSGPGGRASGCGCTATRPPGRWSGMHWATYRFTRTQETFDGVGPGEPD